MRKFNYKENFDKKRIFDIKKNIRYKEEYSIIRRIFDYIENLRL